MNVKDKGKKKSSNKKLSAGGSDTARNPDPGGEEEEVLVKASDALEFYCFCCPETCAYAVLCFYCAPPVGCGGECSTTNGVLMLVEGPRCAHGDDASEKRREKERSSISGGDDDDDDNSTSCYRRSGRRWVDTKRNELHVGVYHYYCHHSSFGGSAARLNRSLALCVKALAKTSLKDWLLQWKMHRTEFRRIGEVARY